MYLRTTIQFAVGLTAPPWRNSVVSMFPNDYYKSEFKLENLDIFDPRFDEVFAFFKGISVKLDGRLDFYRSPGVYLDSSTLVDSRAELGVPYLSGNRKLQDLKITGTQPDKVRILLSAIRGGKIQPVESWSEQ